MKTKTSFIAGISIVCTIALIGGIFVFKKSYDGSNTAGTASVASDNIQMADGKQIITVKAKGGYSPRITNAKAGMPTILKVNTQGTFDCSSALTIPTLSYRKNLPPSGETIVEIPAQQAGTSMKGLCAMGMYNFTINFN